MRNIIAVVALALSLSACVDETSKFASSWTYLGAQNSRADLAHPSADSAREIVRLLETRGYAMLDQHANSAGELVLKFSKTNRPLAADKSDDDAVGARDVGSVVYAWITPTGPQSSRIALVGKPTLNGQEPCTTDTDVQLQCAQLTVLTPFRDTYFSGRNEADVVHGVLSELQLEGYVTGAPPLGAVPQPAAPLAPIAPQ